MRKEERLQIRVEAEQMEFLRAYAARRNITISRMVRDFIDWLKRREDHEGNSGASRASESHSN